MALNYANRKYINYLKLPIHSNEILDIFTNILTTID